MEFIVRCIPANFNLMFSGDWHKGTLLHSDDALDKFVDMVMNPYDGVSHNVVIGMGDYMEAIDTSDKRFDIDSVDMDLIRPDRQKIAVQEAIEPFKKKVATLLIGNHEYKLERYHPYVASICRELDIPYGTYSAIVDFRWAKDDTTLFKAFATHGSGSIRSTADDPERLEANMNLSLKRKLKNKAGDCAIMAMGHTHKLLVAKPKTKLYITTDEDGILKQNYTESGQADNYIHPDHRWYLNTGSMMTLYHRGISGYAERAMYDPMEMGFCVVKVRDKKIIDVEKIFL